MKTVLHFQEEGRKIIFKHKPDIKIYRDIREDQYAWEDADGNIIRERQFIVIKLPKFKKEVLSQLKWNKHDRLFLGYQIREFEDWIEVLFYDRNSFFSAIYELEKLNLFKVTQRTIPDFTNNGTMFPTYINARGIWQVTYNVIFGILELPFILHKINKEKGC